MARLKDICTKASSNIAQKDLENCDGDYPIYGASGLIKYVNFYQQKKPYIAVVKDGAGVGRVMQLPAKSSIIGTMQYIIPNADVNASYLAYAMEHMNLAKYYTGATIPHIYFKDYCEEIVQDHDANEQHRIALVLDKVTGLLSLRKQQLTKLDELVKARFVEMFGDPVQNPLDWKTTNLSSLGSCKNGMNFHADDSGVDIRCLGVGDFKNLSAIDDISKLSKVSLAKMPIDEYLLQDGDIVFVRSNGNKALVGRCLAIYPVNTPTTFSGFCIRFRLNEEKAVLTSYLLMVLKTNSMRKKMAGRGANIQNLNQKILSELIIPVPPVQLQQEFSNFLGQIEQSRLTIQQSLDKLEVVKKSLMQKYFG